MNVYKKLMLLVGIAVVVIVSVTIVSLRHLTTTFKDTGQELRHIAEESRQIAILERKIDELIQTVQDFVMTGDRKHMRAYQSGDAELHRALISATEHGGPQERMIVANLTVDVERIRKKAERIFALQSPGRGQQALAANLAAELNQLHAWMERDIVKYQASNAAEMQGLLEQIDRNDLRVHLLFLIVLLTSLSALFAFVVYFHRKVSVPLNDLWNGTEEISRGNLDYQVAVRGEDDIARLGGRFNEMAQRLRFSYAELEQKLYERTHELASLDAVALTLSQAGSLRDMLDKSLLRILESLSGIQPRGGVFLCEPGGEILRLMTQKGLSPEFAQRESVIKMGECLCGIVAQTGELLFTEHGCDDQRHTRSVGEESHSHIIIPIKSRGIVLGVIFLYPQKDFKLKPSDVQMLDAMGAQLGMAVENFRFYAEVKESSEKYWDLFENATDILFTMDASGRLNAVNKAAETFSGYSKVELFGKNVFDLLTDESAETARRLLSSGVYGRQWTELEVVKRDGARAFVEVSLRRLLRKQQSAGYQVSARDVTEQKKLRDMLLQAERLCAIGEVVVAVRHEINNPLTTVIGNTELLLERYEGRDRELVARLEVILNNALRIAEIVKQLQGIRKDQVVEYLKGVKMTDLNQK